MTATLATTTVVSADGTTIAHERTGSGPCVIVVDGALCYREFGPSRKIAAALTGFTTCVYDRRGRGESGAGESAYEPAREVEDIAALIEAAGGSATLVGLSSGAILATDAATVLAGVSALVAYEPPVVIDSEGGVAPTDYIERLQAAVDADRPGDAVKIFMRRVGAPAPAIAIMRLLPMWKKLVGVGHTLPYDAAVCGDTQYGRPLAAGRWTTLDMPTIVLTGGKTWPWIIRGAQALADLLDAERDVLPKQKHNVKPAVLADAVTRFLDR